MRFLAKKILNNQAKRTNTHYLDQRISHLLFAQIKSLRAKTILLYCPMKHEINLLPLIHRLKKQGLNVFVPQIKNNEMQVVRFALPFKKGKYGIRESAHSKPYNGKIDVAIVPILGLDSTWRRVGFGMGYYDRFFATKLHKPYIIFASRIAVFSERKITEKHDIRADFLITWELLKISEVKG